MEYFNSLEDWEKRIKNLQRLINEGWDMPPLIAENTDGKLIIRDGNHSIEAMKRENFHKCWVITWDSTSEDNLKNFFLNPNI